MKVNAPFQEIATPPAVAQVPKLALSLKEAAEALGVSYISIWRLTKRGKLRTVKALRTPLVPVVELQRFLASECE